MADLNHSFDQFAFTPEEKEQLTDRLRQAGRTGGAYEGANKTYHLSHRAPGF